MQSSKTLKHNDSSGDDFANYVFGEIDDDFILSFDRIQFNYLENKFILFDHILIDQDLNINEPPKSKKIQSQIKKINLLKKLIKEKSGLEVDVIISFYQPVKKQDQKLLILKNGKITETNIDEFGKYFGELNFFGNKDNKGNKFIDTAKPKERTDDSAFSFTQYLLAGNVTYGFNLDLILFHEGSFDVYEFLLCESKQTVNPYTSHPNRYFYKNSQKFISLFNLSKLTNTNLYFLNYAKEDTEHSDKVLFMKAEAITKNKKEPIQTINKRTTKNVLKQNINKRYKNKKQSIKNKPKR